MSRQSREREARLRVLQNEGSEAWQAAIELRHRLLNGWSPEPMQLWGVVLPAGDRLLFDLHADYARHYGGSGHYTHTNGMFLGSAPFMIAGFAATAVANRRARANAAYEAQPRWREQQHTRVLVTEQRLICECGGRWLNFDYSAVSGFYPELMSYGLVLDFSNSEPLALSGPPAPFLTVFLTFVLYGMDGLQRHPALEPLRAALPAPPIVGTGGA